ncbi:MAG: nicotinamide mononucleotide transporter [Clostridia bacterium]|nr:nicotinamide mononucleotide transporter [Clostridia bacterium]
MIKNPFRDLTKFELTLWICSIFLVTLSFLISVEKNPLTLIASLIGVTALIFTAKGYLLGQILIVVFSVFYGIISLRQQYYGEMITYLGMSSPIAILAAVSWFKNPYKNSREVTVSKPSKKQLALMFSLSAIVTIIFYFILRALGNASLIVSTFSVTTSFIAAYLTFLRSPYYALGYALNDIVLIILWSIAAISAPENLPMLICFAVFLVNDLYGFINWCRMEKRQRE